MGSSKLVYTTWANCCHRPWEAAMICFHLFSCHSMSIVWSAMQGPLWSAQHGCHRGLWTTSLVRTDGLPDIPGCYQRQAHASGYGLHNRLASSNALVSHKTSPDRTTSWMGGISHAHYEYANSPIWACGCYHRSRAVPICWPSTGRIWLVTCQVL